VNSVVHICFSVQWRIPVHVGCLHTAAEDDKGIAGPADAIRYLNESFQCKSGSNHWRAMKLCRAALRREVNRKIARAHSVAA
jgi:hypothetical protein